MGHAIGRTIEQALKLGVLTPAAQREVELLCQGAQQLSVEQQMALKRLMRSLKSGAVLAVPPQDLRNILEELVLSEAIAQVAALGNPAPAHIDLQRLAATALNHLPPLYASTAAPEAALRDWASVEMESAIRHQVSEALGKQLLQTDPGVPRPLGREAFTAVLTSFSAHADQLAGTFSADRSS